MTFVKICGITNLDDALLSVEYGADALGFNFYRKSRRYIAPGAAERILGELPSGVTAVGVFVDEDPDAILDISGQVGLNAVQLHGYESVEYVETLHKKVGLKIIKAFRVAKDFSSTEVELYKHHAILMDAYSPREFGGTGESFDWEIARQLKAILRELYLAGGLSAENVGDAIAYVKPFAVDACSSLEASPGVKDPKKLRRFIEAAKRA